MKLSEFADKIQFLNDTLIEDPNVVIKTSRTISTIGGTPITHVESLYEGFDWDSGNIIIQPSSNLYPEKDVDTTAKKLQDELGKLWYETQGLKAEIRRLKKLLKEKE